MLAKPPRVRPAGEARPRAASRAKAVCPKTPSLPVGDAFTSECAPATASAVEAQLRHDLAERLEFTAGLNAVRVARPFFEHLEVWPDIVIPELRIAVEYDSTGRHGLEHVGRRQDADLRKDRALRRARWEVVRIRTGRLEMLGPWDLQVSGTGRKTVARLLEVFGEIRGELIVERIGGGEVRADSLVLGQQRRRPSRIATELRGPGDRRRAELVAHGVEHRVESRPLVPVDRQLRLEVVDATSAATARRR